MECFGLLVSGWVMVDVRFWSCNGVEVGSGSDWVVQWLVGKGRRGRKIMMGLAGSQLLLEKKKQNGVLSGELAGFRQNFGKLFTKKMNDKKSLKP